MMILSILGILCVCLCVCVCLCEPLTTLKCCLPFLNAAASCGVLEPHLDFVVVEQLAARRLSAASQRSPLKLLFCTNRCWPPCQQCGRSVIGAVGPSANNRTPPPKFKFFCCAKKPRRASIDRIAPATTLHLSISAGSEHLREFQIHLYCHRVKALGQRNVVLHLTRVHRSSIP